jgi:hypothetical protein
VKCAYQCRVSGYPNSPTRRRKVQIWTKVRLNSKYLWSSFKTLRFEENLIYSLIYIFNLNWISIRPINFINLMSNILNNS